MMSYKLLHREQRIGGICVVPDVKPHCEMSYKFKTASPSFSLRSNEGQFEVC